jgi:methionyl-tRNA formyltransferase
LAADATGIAVVAQGSSVLLQELQRPGGKRLAVADFLRGFDVQVGMRFDLTEPSRDAAGL